VTLERELAEIVGAQQLLSDPELTAAFERDYSGRYAAPARCVVRPADPAEVAAVMAACSRHGAPVVPQGGNTGLVGAGVPRQREVVVSLRRLDEIGEVDAAAGQVTVGAGVPLAALQRAARAAARAPARTSCSPGTRPRSRPSAR